MHSSGWQFGENLRTQLFGWFPVAYTENEFDEQNHWSSMSNGHHASNGQQQMNSSSGGGGHQNAHHPRDHTPDSSLDSSTLIEEDEDETAISSKLAAYQDEHSPTRMFGDTIMYRQSKQCRRISGNNNQNGAMNGMPKPGPPPAGPAPIPQAVPTYGSNGKNQISQSHSFSSNGGPPIIENRKSMPATLNFSKQVCAALTQSFGSCWSLRCALLGVHAGFFIVVYNVFYFVYGNRRLVWNRSQEAAWQAHHCIAPMIVVLPTIRHHNLKSITPMKRISIAFPYGNC